MQAIRTQYFGATNSRGSRIKATAQDGSVTVYWDYALNVSDNHRRAALALANKFGWTGEWLAGELADQTTVFVNERGFGEGFRS